MASGGKKGSREDTDRAFREEPVRGPTGVPGQWLLARPWPDDALTDHGAWLASSLRLLRNLSAAFGPSGGRGEPAGRVEVVPGSEGPLSLGAARWPQRAGAVPLVKVPESFLLSSEQAQREALDRLLAGHGPSGSEASEKSGRGPGIRRRKKNGRTLVAFVTPASLSEAREREYTGVPPAAFFMAPALLRKGFQVAVDTLVLDAFAEPALCPEAVRKKNWTALDGILGRRPFCIAVTAMDLYADSLRAFLRQVRARDRDVLVALGGPMVTLYGARAAVHLPEANIFLRGDGDFAFARVLSALAGQLATQDLGERPVRRLSSERGLLVRCGGTLFLSRFDEANLVEDLDSVFRRGIDLGYVEKRHLRKGFSLHTLRGCPYRCSFCVKVHGSGVRKLRLKTLGRVLEALNKRIKAVAAAEGFTETERRQAYRLHLTDDDFLLDRRRAKLFFRAAARSPFSLETLPAGIPSFLAAGRAGERRFDSGLAACLGDWRDRIGSFEIGTDDFSERELRRLAKAHPGRYSLGEIREVVAVLERLGIRNRHFVLLSNPDTRWPELFEKIVTLEQLIWEFNRFLADPNPFVLAPVGTPLFEDLAAKGRLDAVSKRVLSVEGYPEFTHWAVNVAVPDEKLFSSPILSCRRFFQRLVDLLKGPQRFSVFNDVYLQYLLWRRKEDSAGEGPEERGAVLRLVEQAVNHRRERVRAWLQGAPFPGGEQAGPCRQENRLVEILWGLSLVGRTRRELFPEASQAPWEDGHPEEPGRGALPALLSAAGEPEPIPDRIAAFRQAVRLAESHAEHPGSASGPGAGGCDFARSFVLAVRSRLEERGLAAEAMQWESLCAQGREMVRLEVSADRSDARIVEDSGSIERTTALIRAAKPGFAGPEAFLPYLRSLRVLERTIREDFLEASSETRRVLYGRLLDLPAEFQARFGREFGLCPFVDRDGFLAALLARYLGARAIPHDRESAGTRLFEGLEPVLDSLVPPEIERFAAWLLNSTCRTSGTRSGRNHSGP